MDAGQDIVNARRGVRRERESRCEQLFPLERLVHHEERAEGERRDQRPLQSTIRSLPCEHQCEDHREPAREQDDRVESAKEDVVDRTGLGPSESAQRAVHPEEHEGTEERPEKRDFTKDEKPHPEGEVLQAVERPLFPDGLDGLASAERLVAPTDEGDGKNHGSQDERG